MGAVLVDEDAGVVEAVVGVAAHVPPALQHQHVSAAVLRQPPGGYRPGVARADNQCVMVVHLCSRPLVFFIMNQL